MKFSDELIRLPRKIDMFNWAPLSGGDFLINLISRSDYITKSKDIMKQDDIRFVDISGGGERIDECRYQQYLPNTLFYEDISLFYHIDELEDAIKYDIIKTFLMNSNYKEYKDVLLFQKSHLTCPKKYVEKINSLDFIDFVDLSPESSKGKSHCFKANKKIHVCVQNTIIYCLKQSRSYKTVIESFPFLDYVIDNDFNSIKDWIENRYGSNFDFDFIDKKLIWWKKIRVDPYV